MRSDLDLERASMIDASIPIAADQRLAEEQIEFSVCTLVTNRTEYTSMLRFFEQQGFHAPHCEFLYLDNCNGNRYDAYRGLNVFLRAARGRYVVLCHQDVELRYDDIDKLRICMSKLDSQDPQWALAGNAGGNLPGQPLTIHISDPHGEARLNQSQPVRVQSLDENFIVAKAAANLALSADLFGFHLYGADLCTIADILGYRSYVIDFLLLHKSRGAVRDEFHSQRERFATKYTRALRIRWIATTCTLMFLSGSHKLTILGNRWKVMRAVRTWFRLRKC